MYNAQINVQETAFPLGCDLLHSQLRWQMMVAQTRVPSPEEIKRLCQQIQATWTPWQERLRQGLEPEEEPLLPMVVCEMEVEGV